MALSRVFHCFCPSALLAFLMAALSAGAQSYPDVHGTSLLVTESWTINSLIGGTNDVESFTNSYVADVVQTGASFVIVPTGTDPSKATRTNFMAGNSVIAVIGAGVTFPAPFNWSVGSNSITGVLSGTISTTGIKIVIAGAASGLYGPANRPFNSSYQSTIQVSGIFHPLASPTITSQPTNTTVVQGQSATFTVQATGATNLVYQWLKNGNAISGATGTNYAIKSAQASDVGSYVAQVSNAAGTNNSDAASLTVLFPPSITTQPFNPTLALGTKGTLSVVAAGTPPLSYQWYLFGSSILNATNASYSFIATNVPGYTNLQFSVTVTNNYGAVASTTAIVTISHDKVPPGLSLSTPAANGRLESVLLSGVATDNAIVAKVSYWLTNINNGIKSVGARIDVPLNVTNLNRVNWSYWPDLLPGTNIVTVVSQDLQGNLSKPITRTFFYRSPASFTLMTNGAGKLVGKSSVAGAREPVPGLTNMLYIGQGYSLQAKPAANWLFTNWTFNGVDVSTNPTLSFIMEPGLELRANFVTNLFVKMAGTYYGLLTSTNLDPNASGMLRQLTVTANGTYSGQLILDGTTFSLSGTFDLSGHARKTISRPPSAGGSVALDLYLDWNNSVPAVHGTASNSSWNAEITAALANPSFPSSQYSVVVPSDRLAISNGYSYLTIGNKGSTAIIAGMLADGTSITPASTVVGDGQVPIYASLYNGNGMFTGWLSLTNPNESSEIIWVNKSQTGGFTNAAPASISQWHAPAAKTPALTYSVDNPGLLQLVCATLPAPLSFKVAVSNNNAIVKLPGSPANLLTGTVDPKTGGFKITFGTTGKSTVTGSGVILDNCGFGVFLLKTNPGSIYLANYPAP